MLGRQTRKAAIASMIGTTIEWYDFFVYGTASALVLGPLFFSTGNNYENLLASFASFAVGFIARPMGGFLFGHFGDRIGRKTALVSTLILMGSATFLIGVLPTKAQIGMWAPILLVLLRVIQGISVGGEWGGAVLMAGEHATPEKRTWFASFAQLGSPLGVLLSLGSFRAASAISGDQFMIWGWRLPFLVTSVLLVVGIFIRLAVEESPEFLAETRAKKIVDYPLLEAFKVCPGNILCSILAFTIGISGFYFTNTFMISYGTNTLGIDRGVILDCLTIVSIIQLVGQLVAAKLAEKIGDVPVLLMTSGLAIAAPYPMFLMAKSAVPSLIVAGISLATLCASGFYAVIAGYTSKLFPPRVRYSAISASYQLGGAIFGGFTPMIGVMLEGRYPAQWLPLAILYSILGGISFMGVLLLSIRNNIQSHRDLFSEAALATRSR